MENLNDTSFTNVTSLDVFRKKRETFLAQKSLKEYFNVLSFSELLNESTHLSKELKNSPLNSQISLRSTLILKELHDRIRDSKEMHEALNEMCEESEALLKTLFKKS